MILLTSTCLVGKNLPLAPQVVSSPEIFKSEGRYFFSNEDEQFLVTGEFGKEEKSPKNSKWKNYPSYIYNHL